ncbi:hypothetical protein [Deinococcus fonticola]|uniref:hypothetical protein n=1 Tax=Deinococcus fonticola TaxID=2528713 RepID=UPI001075756F|nr:hypothetical protein [Deinococcus fonticola]
MAELWIFGLLALPMLALGFFLLWFGGYTLWAYLFGGQVNDPYQWPEVKGNVMDYDVEREYRGNRIALHRGTHTELVNVKVTVQLPDGALAQVNPPELWQMKVVQPEGLNFRAFMRQVDELALAQAKRTLPVGSQITVASAQAAGSRFSASTGRRWTAAFSKGSSASRPVAIFAMLMFSGVGIGLLAVSALMIWGAFASQQGH